MSFTLPSDRNRTYVKSSGVLHHWTHAWRHLAVPNTDFVWAWLGATSCASDRLKAKNCSLALFLTLFIRLDDNNQTLFKKARYIRSREKWIFNGRQFCLSVVLVRTLNTECTLWLLCGDCMTNKLCIDGRKSQLTLTGTATGSCEFLGFYRLRLRYPRC